MNWFFEIFENNSDKARMIAIIISSLVAFALFFLNQFFQNKREKVKLLVEKTEELYKAVLGLEHSALDYLNETHELPLVYNKNSGKTEIENAVKEQLYQIRMLVGLYFSDISEFSGEGWEKRLSELRAKMAKLAHANRVGERQYGPIYKELEDIIGLLKAGCKKISVKYKY